MNTQTGNALEGAIEQLAYRLYSVQERLDPTEDDNWFNLRPVQKHYFRRPVIELLLEKDLILAALADLAENSMGD